MGLIPLPAVLPTPLLPKQTGIDRCGRHSIRILTGDWPPRPADDILAAGQDAPLPGLCASLDAADSHIMSTPTDGRSGTTANPLKPEPPTALRATADSHTSIKLRWTPPDDDGRPVKIPNTEDDDDDGSEEGPSVIVGYYIQYLDDGASTWAHIKNKDGGNLITDAKGKAGRDVHPRRSGSRILPGVPDGCGEQDQ